MTNTEIAQHAREIADWLEREAPPDYSGYEWIWTDAEGKEHG